MRPDELSEARHEFSRGPIAAADRRIVALLFARQIVARQDERLFLVGILVGIGLGIHAPDRHPALPCGMRALVELRLLGARQREEHLAPGMRDIELALRDAVIGKIEEAGIGTCRPQRASDLLALIEAAALGV